MFHRLLNEESRRTNAEITEVINRVNTDVVVQWKAEMNRLKNRLDSSSNYEVDQVLAVGSRSGRVRCDQNWTDEEKKDAIRCKFLKQSVTNSNVLFLGFHWYNDDFDTVSEVMGTKTTEQVKAFYEKHKEVIEKVSIIDRTFKIYQFSVDLGLSS